MVHSAGVIEHFQDPREIVKIHVKLLKPGGAAIITVPNLSGTYRRLAEYCDLANVKLHNLSIMNHGTLADLAPRDLCEEVKVYSFGRVCLGAINLDKKLHSKIALILSHAVNCVAMLQPVNIPYFCPQLVLRMVRRHF